MCFSDLKTADLSLYTWRISRKKGQPKNKLVGIFKIIKTCKWTDYITLKIKKYILYALHPRCWGDSLKKFPFCYHL